MGKSEKRQVMSTTSPCTLRVHAAVSGLQLQNAQASCPESVHILLGRVAADPLQGWASLQDINHDVMRLGHYSLTAYNPFLAARNECGPIIFMRTLKQPC